MRPPDFLRQPDPMRTAAHRRPYDREQVQRYDDQLAQLDRNHRAQQLATKIRAIRRPPPGTPDAGAPATGPAALRLPAGSETRFPATTTGSGAGAGAPTAGVGGASDSPHSGEIRIDLRRLRRAELIAKCERLGVLTDGPQPGPRAAALTGRGSGSRSSSGQKPSAATYSLLPIVRF